MENERDNRSAAGTAADERVERTRDAFDEAPLDDEPFPPHQRAEVEAALEEYLRDGGVSLEELRRELAEDADRDRSAVA